MSANPYQPPKANLQMDKEVPLPSTAVPKIGGWLYLVGAGLVISPFRILNLLLSDYVPIFRDGLWQQLTTPGSAAYHPLWGPLLAFEAIGNVGKLVLGLVALMCFLKRSRLTPKLLVSWYTWMAVYSLIDYFFANLIPHVAASDSSDSVRDLVRSLLAAAIWIPYFLVSQRVKDTFVR